MKKLLSLLAIVFLLAIAPSTATADEANASAIVKITNNNYDAIVAKNKLVVIDFWATWCPPCVKLTPILEELAKEYKGKIVVGKCDVDNNRDLTTNFGVRSIPALFFIKNGKVVDQHIGYSEKAALKEKFESLLK